MVVHQRFSLVHILDEGRPPPLFAALAKKWETREGNNEALKTSGRSSRASADLSVGALSNNGDAPYKVLHSLTGRHAKGVDHLTLFVIYG